MNQIRGLAAVLLFILFAVSCRSTSSGPMITMTSKKAGLAGELEFHNYSSHTVAVQVNGVGRVIHSGGNTKYTALSAHSSLELFVQKAGSYNPQISTHVDTSYSGLFFGIR